MPTLRFHIVIQRSCETVYQTLADIAGYNSWLFGSQIYRETTSSSDYPVHVGSTYEDHGRSSVMQGQVTELVPGKVVAFHQTTHAIHDGKRRGLDIAVRYRLTPLGQGTRVERSVRLDAHGSLFLLFPFLLPPIYRENQRIMQALKKYLEARV